MVIKYPDPFLEVRAQELEPPAVVGLCAGYDGGQWRAERLADHLFQWLPFVALNQEHQLSFAADNFVEMLRLAAAHIYKTKKTDSRGELGELLLHLACIQEFGTIPVMCKLVLKSSSNDTVKGFDGVHLVTKESGFEMWLGESKFYIDGKQAIRDAVSSVNSHILPQFLNAEKAMIFGHIGTDIPHRDDVIKLFKSQTSGDELVKKAVFPILIAYESAAVSNFAELSDEYIATLKSEVEGMRSYFSERAEGITLRFQLIFVPMASKASVVDSFDQKLEAFL